MELKNYRCFPDTHPARFELGPGFSSFVGTNNSGKSTLLRFFYEFRNVFTSFSDPNGSFLNTMMAQPWGMAFLGVSDPAEVSCDANDRDMSVTIAVEDDEPTETPYPSKLEISVARQTSSVLVQPYIDGEKLQQHSLGWDGDHLNAGGVGRAADMGPYFRAFRLLASSLYIGPFRNAINIGSTENYYDLNVGQAFITAWRRFKTGPTRSERAAAIEVTEAIRRIFDFDDLEINASDDGLTLVINIDDKPYRLQELGAGIAHFIIVLAYVATRKPSLILIDEPESNLHPSLQLDFLTTLGTFSSFGVAYATHSMGLARAGSERVFSLRRVKQGESLVTPYEATPNLAEFLGALSFAGYQELGFDRVLLVEGTSDVTALQRLLRRFGIEHKLVLLPLGGAALINEHAEPHLVELKRITPNITALIDSERSAAGDPPAERVAFKALCEGLDIQCHILDRRALENYFPERAIQAVKGHKYRELGPYESLKDADPAWAKAENWRIAGAMTEDEVAAAGDLGPFLQTLAGHFVE